ncbi:MAG: hypothetical protein OXN25_14085 [Candidatus Poribacteria bacterium]|nr:hypothetical protein [Candidatus Poribacteria bacterium]
MFIQKCIAGLRFLGTLFLRSLCGIIAAYLWLFAVAVIFHIAVGNPPLFPHRGIFEIFDHFYDSGPPRDERYGGTAGEFYPHALSVGTIGFLVWLAAGVIWGFLQGRLDPRKWPLFRS